MKSAFSLLFFIIFYCACPTAEASSLPGAVKGLRVDEISSFDRMKTALALLKSCSKEARTKNRFPFSLQKLVLSKTGECVSKIIILEQGSEQPYKTKTETARALLLTGRQVVKEILLWNQKKVLYLQENELDHMQDTDTFFASPEWQQPQHLISLASYWLSWTAYYSCLFYPANDPFRGDLLDEAVEGFSRSFIDFNEESIVSRSLFGRALCYREMQKYDKAIQDLNSVSNMLKQGSALSVRCRYEKIMITCLTGHYEAALKKVDNFQMDFKGAEISREMDIGLKKLRIKIILALLEKEKNKQGKTAKKFVLEILQEMKRLTESKESQAGELYRFAKDHVPILVDMPYAELGHVGNLAIADWYFNRKEYDKAIERYGHLRASSGRLIKKRMDEIFFRLGYCFCRKGQWQKAFSCFESIFKIFPSSPFLGKTACLNFVAAANNYRENPETDTYTRYINSIKTYLQHCPDPSDESEAHFQLGKYYQDKGRERKALGEFSLVKDDSPNYMEAQYCVIKANMDKLETFHSTGLSQSKAAKRVYDNTIKALEKYQDIVLKEKDDTGKKELEAHLTILRARLYAYGPEETCRKALGALNDFDARFQSKKNSGRLSFTAMNLRMLCYQKLQMFSEAEEEINMVLNKGVINQKRWGFLNACAARFYQESKRSRDNGNTSLAHRQAEMALMIYNRLSPVAATNPEFNKFHDSIQLRMAEIYLDENQLEKGEKIYREKLNRDPLSADAIYNLGLIQEKQGKWEEALASWKKFSRGLKTGSYYWFESRYRTAVVLDQIGKRDKACEVITVMQVLHPELRDKKFREKFIQLQKDICEGDGD